MEPLTMRERMLVVLQGRELERVPFVMCGRMLPVHEVFELLRACLESYVYLQAVQPTKPQPGYVPGDAA